MLQICAELFGLKGTVDVHTPEYVDFDKKIKSFINRYDLANTQQYCEISRHLLTETSQYLSANELQVIIQSLMSLKKLQNPTHNRFDRIFISHSGNDINYVKPFVRLLKSLGLNHQTMFCSSVEGYGIPLGQNIYEYLKAEFTNKNILVVMIMSNNYYDSKPCLNEMGATWVMSKEYITILVNGFDFSQIKGSVDPQKIGFKITDVYRLNEFKNKLVEGLNLKTVSDYNWDSELDKFLSEICRL